jgi:hypothetical protein
MAGPLKLLAVAAMLAFVPNCDRKSEEPAAKAAAERWLRQTETGPDLADLIKQLRENPQVAEAVFIEAFNNGPTEAERETLADTIDWHWAMMQVQLADPEAYGLSDSEKDAMKSISLSEEKSEELLTFEYNYKAAALTGLAITHGQAGKQLLDRVAADRNSPYWNVAIGLQKPSR